MGHYNELGGHMGASKTYANAKRFYYWPGMFDWICALTADCLACQNKKPKPKHLNKVLLEEWQGDTAPFWALHIDHNGPLHPLSNQNTHCLLIFDSFLRFLMVYPVNNTGAQATIAAVEKWILHFGIPQSIIHDRGTTFLNTDFVNWTKELGITLRPRTAPTVAFAHNSSVDYTTGKTPYGIVFGAKPQIPMSVKLGIYRNKHNLCCSEFYTDLPPHTHEGNSTKNELIQKLLRPQFSQALLDREKDFKRIYSPTFEQCREQTARSHACRNRLKLGHHLAVGQKFFTKSTGKTYQKVRNYNNDDWVHSLLPNESLVLPTKFKTTKTHPL